MTNEEKLERKRKRSREWARKDRLENPDKHKVNHRKARKSLRGYLVEKHYAITRRCKGFEKKKSHLYDGLYFVSKDVFLDWAINNKDYIDLYDNYVLSNYDNKLAPSIDRLDSNKGYIISNMRFITHSENSRLGSISRWANVKMDL